MIDMPVSQQDLLGSDAVLGDGLLDALKIAARVDDSARLGLLIPQEGAVLLERGDRHDGGFERHGTTGLRKSGPSLADPATPVHAAICPLCGSGRRVRGGSAKAGGELKPYRELAGSAHRALGPGDWTREGKFGYALEQLLDGNRHLQSRKVGADTAVDAEPEGGVPILRAVDDHPVGVPEHLGVAVGGREGQQYHLARLERAA